MITKIQSQEEQDKPYLPPEQSSTQTPTEPNPQEAISGKNISAILRDAAVRQKVHDIGEARKHVIGNTSLETRVETDQTESVPIKHVYAQAKQMGVEQKYVDEAIDAHVITKARQKRDLNALNAQESYELTHSREVRGRTEFFDYIQKKVLDALAQAYPSLTFEALREHNNHFLYSISVGRIKFQLVEEVTSKNWTLNKILQRIRVRHRTILAECEIDRSDNVSSKIVASIRLHDSRFTNVYAQLFPSLKTENEGRVIFRQPTYYYDPEKDR
ncbi:hypothetical protein HY486_04375 [Candidatus Woesearchaeota archaeon]|nr:hypothetical protein [Candidatus Woesearchaeota archaeon]